MLVRDAMTSHVTTVAPTTSVLAALRLLHKDDIRHLPVIDDHGTLVGIVSDRDLTPATRTAPSTSVRGRTVRQLMTSPVRWTRPDDNLVTATRQMLDWHISALPVVEHQRVVGILTTTDCLHAMLTIADDQQATSRTG
jgi:acetoin utilization protein AcuB